MFPSDITCAVTLFPAYTDKQSGEQTNIRCVLQNCFWNEDSIAIFQRSGQATDNSVTLFIPHDPAVTGREYVTPEEWYNLAPGQLDNYWTVDPRRLPIMLRGESGFEFTWAMPDAKNRIAEQERLFQLEGPGTRLRVKDVDVQLFGSRDMRHIKLRA